MLFEVCNEIHNFFDYERVYGKITISNGELVDVSLEEGQYFRIVGSVLNDGVYQYPADSNQLLNETFDGAVWKMAVPRAFLELCEEIEGWKDKYLSVDSMANSPFTSESFGGYSYSKNAASVADGGSGASWQNAFATRLNAWRKPRCRY